MTVTRERFEQGLTFEEFKAQMTRNRERLEANERDVALDPEDLAAFRSLLRPLHVLVLAEEWCGDVIANLPVLARLARESGKLDVRLFLRDQNKDLMGRYLKAGRFESIPVFAFFDDDFSEVGVFIERPASVSARRAEKIAEIYARNPEFGSPDDPLERLPEETRRRLQEAFVAMRAELKPFSDREVVRELRTIVGAVPV